MASVNKAIILEPGRPRPDLLSMYADDKLSIPEVSAKTGIPLSTLRFRLLKSGVIRSRADGVRNAVSRGLVPSRKGMKRVFTDEWKRNISISKLAAANKKAVGYSLKPSGYLEITRGENKGRGQHVVIAEQQIGRPIKKNEAVHHKDGNRGNNNASNLQVMTRSEHASHHATENLKNRKRNDHGQFE